MKRTMMWAALATSLWACNEGSGTLPGTNGDTVWVTCDANNPISYDYAYACGGSNDPGACEPLQEGLCPTHSADLSGTVSFCEDVSKGQLDEPGLFAQHLEMKCAASCPDEVREQACPMGRHPKNITGCEDLQPQWQRQSCATQKLEEQVFELTYAPLVGDPMHTTGTLQYTYETTRTGPKSTLWAISLARPLMLNSGIRNATELMGYPEGTEIEVRRISLSNPTPLQLDRNGRATLRAGTVDLSASVVVTTPGVLPNRTQLHAEVPLTLDLSVTRDGVSIGKTRGPFGGVFSFSRPSAR